MKEINQSLGVWQYFMLFLSIFALLILAVQSFVHLNPSTNSVLYIIDTIICVFFFADFLWQLYHTRPRTAYLKWGWLDLIASIPMFPAFRVARLARIARIIRVLRAGRASKSMLKLIFFRRAKSTFAAVIFGSLILLLFSVIAIVNVEPSLAPRDAFWWCLFTLITGEYGDFYPASTEGRVITALLMTAGVAIFGTFTASIASFFLGEEQKEDERRDVATLATVNRLGHEISELRNQIKMQGERND